MMFNQASLRWFLYTRETGGIGAAAVLGVPGVRGRGRVDHGQPPSS
jgi:hypothetical protein